jgi:hypothetical protein
VIHNPRAMFIDDRWMHTRVVMDRWGNLREETCAARTSEGEWLDRVHAFLLQCPDVFSRHDRTGHHQGAVDARAG